MKPRSLLKTGRTVALGALSLRAVQSGLTLTMPAEGSHPPGGWTPMPDPAEGPLGSSTSLLARDPDGTLLKFVKNTLAS
jgi:hypothetical protein